MRLDANGHASAALVAAAIIVAACSADIDTEIKARNAYYRFPTADMVAVTTSPHRLVRLSPAGEPFDLVFDSRIDDQVDRRGHPKVFSINDGPLFAINYTPTPAGVVACRPTVASMECGMALVIGGEHWSMIFPGSRKGEVAAMAKAAATYVQAHRLPERDASPT